MDNPYTKPPLTNRERLKRTIFWMTLAFLALVAVLLIYAWPYIQAAKLKRDWNNFVSKNRQDMYEQKLADKVGSSTPEGTFYEYRAALERGDLEGAAAYFVRENRAQHLEELKKENMPDLFNYLRRIENDFKNGWHCNNENTICGTSSTVAFDVEKYPFGNWKIIDY